MKIGTLIKRRGSKDTQYHVYVALYQDRKVELITTGHRIQLKEWDTKNSCPKNHTGAVAKAINKVKSEVDRAVRLLEASEMHVTPFSVKLSYMQELANRAHAQSQADVQTKANLITVIKLANRWKDEELFRYRASTTRSVTESINQFIDYLKVSGYNNLERRQLQRSIVSGYERYLLEKKKLSDNTHGKRMKHLCWFLKWLDFDVSKIKLRSSKKKIIALTLDELKALEAVDVSTSVEQQKAKDLFLLGCYTGLRISDLKRINPVNTMGGFISMKLTKNSKFVKIPIIKSAAAILEKYHYKAPRISLQALNEQIKVVCAAASINTPVVVDMTKAGQRISKTKPKHDLISSHNAGKTFITLAPKLWGLTPADIAAIVGKDLKTLINSYFGEQGDEARNKIIEADNRATMQVAV